MHGVHANGCCEWNMHTCASLRVHEHARVCIAARDRDRGWRSTTCQCVFVSPLRAVHSDGRAHPLAYHSESPACKCMQARYERTCAKNERENGNTSSRPFPWNLMREIYSFLVFNTSSRSPPTTQERRERAYVELVALDHFRRGVLLVEVGLVVLVPLEPSVHPVEKPRLARPVLVLPPVHLRWVSPCDFLLAAVTHAHLLNSRMLLHHHTRG